MDDKTNSPWEALSKFIDSVSAGDILWIVITGVLGFILYQFAKEQRKKEIFDWTTVLKWLAVFSGTLALMIFLIRHRISEGGASAWLFFGIASILGIFTVFYIDRKLSNMQKILIGSLYITTGFTFLVFFATGNIPACYSIVSGIFVGFSFAMVILSFRKISDKNHTEEEKKSYDI